MSPHTLLAGAAPLLAALPSQASASDVIGMWGGSDAGVVAVVGIAAAVAWHQIATHRAGLAERWSHLHLAERWHHAGHQVRHAIAYARAHAHLPTRH